MGKWASVDFALCQPRTCDPSCGRCLAAAACARKLLIQEEFYAEPMLLSTKMCVGCGDCVIACPLRAIQVFRGH